MPGGKPCCTQASRSSPAFPWFWRRFTFLERNTRLDVALSWKESRRTVGRLKTLECTNKDLEASWDYFKRRELRKLSAVDATSFALMKRERIRVAFAFDHHFAAAGFRLVD